MISPNFACSLPWVSTAIISGVINATCVNECDCVSKFLPGVVRLSALLPQAAIYQHKCDCYFKIYSIV